MHEWQTHFLHSLRSQSLNYGYQIHDVATYSSCLAIEHMICNRLADLSQTAAEIQGRADSSPKSILKNQDRITKFRDELYYCWQQNISKFLAFGSDRLSATLAARIEAMFTASCIQYSTAMLYLCTSFRYDESASQQSDKTLGSPTELALIALILRSRPY